MVVWKRSPTWTYELFDRDTAAETFGIFAPLVRQWNEKRGDRAQPAWSDYDFYDFKGWHGWVTVQDIVMEPFDLRCRLWGSKLTEILGADNTGKRYSEIGPTSPDTDLADLLEVCRTGSIGRSHGTLDWLKKGHYAAAFIDLPLSNDGTSIDHVLTVMAETVIESE
jgi:hypothetical protein